MGIPVLDFVWTGTGNYPPGANPWNGQPLAVPPIQTYFTPATKPPAENMNSILATIARDLGALDAYLANMIKQGVASALGYTSTTPDIIVPENCYWMGGFLWGGGGGGEGGNRGETGGPASVGYVYPQGGGGGGAPFVFTLFPVAPGDVLKVTVGSKGLGGAPGGGAGGDGGFSRIECQAGAFAGTIYVTAPGGPGCGSGRENWSGNPIAWANDSGASDTDIGNLFATVLAGASAANIAALLQTVFVPTSIPNANPGIDSQGAISPGAIGLAGARAMFPFSTGLQQMIKNGGVIDIGRWVPSFPRRGGSVVVRGNGTSGAAEQVSLPGEQGEAHWGNASHAGGAGGSPGNTHGIYYGGCGGGGGGGGPGGAGGAGGDGGQGNDTGAGLGGHPGFDAPDNSGGGGGGGGGGGWGSASGGAGGTGGNAGAGYGYLFQVSGPP
jgi:hypothetical protein